MNNVYSTLGLIGLISLALMLGGAVLLPMWSLESYWSVDHPYFVLSISAGCWLSTMLIPAIAGIGNYRVMTPMFRWSSNQYRKQIALATEGRRTAYRLSSLYHKSVWITYYFIFVAVPILATLYYYLISNDPSWVKQVPLIYNALFILIALLVRMDMSVLILSILGASAVAVLWYYPFFDPYATITHWIITGEIGLIGLESAGVFSSE